MKEKSAVRRAREEKFSAHARLIERAIYRNSRMSLFLIKVIARRSV